MIFRIEAKEPRIINILTASQEDLKPLKERVSSKRSIRMLIHPFMLEHLQYFAEDPWIDGYKEARDELFQITSEEPLVFGEEAWLLAALPRRLRGIAPSLPEEIYVFPTKYNSPHPCKPSLVSSKTELPRILFDIRDRLQATFLPFTINFNNHPESWDHLAGIFKWLGVETIELGGQDLTFLDASKHALPESVVDMQDCLEKLAQPGSGKLSIPEQTNGRRLIPARCVGQAALSLAYRGFNVSLTLPSSPRRINNYN